MKSKRILWICIAAVAAVGIALTSVGFALGAEMNIGFDRNGAHIMKSNEEILKTYEFENINRMEISSISKDIELIPSDKFRVEVPQNVNRERFSVSEENGTLYVKENNVSIFNFGFFFSGFGGRVKVYYKKDVNFSEIMLNSTSGSLSAAGLSTDNLTAKTVSGGIELSNCKADSAKISTTSGGISGEQVVFLKSDVSSVSGHIQMDKIKGDGISASTTSGGIELTGDLTGDIRANSVSGGVRMALSGARADYSKELSSTSGSITLDSDRQGNRYTERANSGNSISVRTTSGSIKLQFGLQDF